MSDEGGAAPSALSAALHELSLRIAAHFDFTGRGTDMRREIRGGLVTFLTMSYILLVNPQILSEWLSSEEGFVPDKKVSLTNNVASSTAVVCAIGTLAVGWLGNMPLAIGPGMGMNTFFAGSVLTVAVAAEYPAARESFDVATAATFVCGLLVFGVAAANLTGTLLRRLPVVLKSAILVGIGVYQAFIGLRTIRLIQSDPVQLLKPASHFDFTDHSATGAWSQVLFVLTLLFTSSLYVANVNGAILVGITATTIVCWVFSIGGVALPLVPVQMPTFTETFVSMRFGDLFSHVASIGTALSFMLITMFDVGGVAYGVMALARGPSDAAPGEEDVLAVDHLVPAGEVDRASEDESLVDAHGDVMTPKEVKVIFLVVGGSTMLSACLGCSPCILFLECIAGVASGARTGFASVVTSALFFLSVFFVPLFRNVPLCASSPALVLIGCFMMGSAADIPWSDHKLAMPAFLTIILMPFTASITPGIVAGIAFLAAFTLFDAGMRRFGPSESPADDLPLGDSRASDSSSHIHSLGFNTDEPAKQTPGFRVRRAERRPKVVSDA